MSGRCMLHGVALLVLAACSNADRAPGNDTEAALDPAATPSPTISAAQAIAELDRDSIQPDMMDAADLASIGAEAGRCVFRLTRAAFPSLVYGDAQAVIKLNGKLVPLPSTAPGRYADAGLQVALSALDSTAPSHGLHETRLVLRIPGTPDERGYLGYVDCDERLADSPAR